MMLFFFNSIVFIVGWLHVKVELFANDALVDCQDFLIGGFEVRGCVV